MKSGEAFGWVIAGLINDHVLSRWHTPEGEQPHRPDDIETQDNPYCPNCCGPCGAWRDWFSQNKGVTDSYTRHLPDRDWVWMKTDGGVDWEWITRNQSKYKCPNCERRGREADGAGEG